ncbi:transglutaminase-like domain-containing protein [Stenotrophomonas rhizophila]|uniref:Transglutaminase domain-containing protein n=1 Tax=Stenotrophomonas rhizophila TaxID=216778 RepID=A0A7V7YE46_9GAMM|nr:transglutaminase domain-containing protein [Stenotrophomonas rhizophila]KAB7629160.1 transglutaminase domain-containing protein [Stenotrophomonas rhizophila]
MDPVMRKPRLPLPAVWCLCAGLLATPWGLAAAPTALPTVIAGIDRGAFAQAEADIATALQDPRLSAADRQAYAFERERMRRMRLDFTLDAAAAKAQLRRQIPDLREDEFARWEAAGLLEHLDIDGQRRYFKRAPSNLFRISAEARARRAPDAPVPKDGPYEHLHPHHEEIVAAARATGATSLVPRRIEVTQSLVVKPDAVPAGEIIRAWIPYPRAIPGQQQDITWIVGTPAGAQVAPEATLQRTAYLERKAVAGAPTEFQIRYAVTVYARHIAVDPARVQPTPDDPALKPYLAEQAPHIVFTPALRAFSTKVVGTETDPYRIVQKLFDAVDAIPWAGAREYATIANISDYALHAGHADCGQQTLLLIALLRLNGIPARWQSGMVYSDDAVGYNNLHDWGAVYLAPYGWVPMDVTTGRLDSPQPALRDFYLGGLDAYRIAFNDDYGQPLVPAKQHVRSDTVDSQRGEAEWSGGNLYFDQWHYDVQSHVVPLAATR